LFSKGVSADVVVVDVGVSKVKVRHVSNLQEVLKVSRGGNDHTFHRKLTSSAHQSLVYFIEILPHRVVELGLCDVEWVQIFGQGAVL